MVVSVKRQIVRPTRRVLKKAAPSLESRIQPVGTHQIALRMNTYGRGKTGKTRFFSTWPKPALIIGTEDGTLSVSTIKGLDFIQIKRASELEGIVEICQQGKYKSVCLDHGGGLQDLCMVDVLDLEDVPVQKSWGMARREDWSTSGVQTKERMRTLLALAETHGINVNIIAHERNFKEDGSDELIVPTVGSALQPSVANWLNGMCDYICQCFIREETVVTQRRIGKKLIKSKPVKTDKKEFCLRIGPHPVYMTGFRAPPEIVLPDVVVDPSFNKVMSLIKPK